MLALDNVNVTDLSEIHRRVANRVHSQLNNKESKPPRWNTAKFHCWDLLYHFDEKDLRFVCKNVIIEALGDAFMAAQPKQSRLTSASLWRCFTNLAVSEINDLKGIAMTNWHKWKCLFLAAVLSVFGYLAGRWYAKANLLKWMMCIALKDDQPYKIIICTMFWYPFRLCCCKDSLYVIQSKRE